MSAEPVGLRKTQSPPALEADGIGFEVGIAHHVILHPCTLDIRAGELVAILGPSGAGKSTLARLLAGQAPASRGTVVLRGIPVSRTHAPGRLIAYLQQDDILPQDLHVEEALQTTGKIRNPEESSGTASKLIGKLMSRTGITHCCGMPVGRVSGGERRRINICAELMSDPLFLILDEPDTSLDPYHTCQLMKLARMIAHSGRAVIIVTHDVQNLQLFNKVAFLAEGRLVYYGPPLGLPSWFRVQTTNEVYRLFEAPVSAAERSSLAEDWYQRWQARTTGHSGTDVSAGKKRDSVSQGLRSWDLSCVSPRQGWRQFLAVLWRSLLTLARDKLSLALFVIQPVMASVLILALADANSLVMPVRFDMGAKQTLFTLCVVAALIGLINSHREIVRERTIVRQEQYAGLGVGPYILAKLVFLSLGCLIQIGILVMILSIRVKIPDIDLLGSARTSIIAGLVLCALANVSIGLLVSTLVTAARQATYTLVPILVAELSLGGLLFEVRGVLESTAKLTPVYWAYRSLGTAIDVNRFSPVLNNPNAMFEFTTANLGTTWLALIAVTAACILAAALVLSAQHKLRRPLHLWVACRKQSD